MTAMTSQSAEPFCPTAKCKNKRNKVLTGGESIEQLVFYKKLHVKDVKINEVLKTKDGKGVGQGHPASKSLIKKKYSIWTSTTLSLQKSI